VRSAGRIFMILSGLALTAAVVYGLAAKELAGAVMLGVFSVALLYIATVLEHASPYDFAETDPDAEPEVGPSHLFPPSWWPIVMAIGAAVFLFGLKFSIVAMGAGVIVFAVAMIGWYVQAGKYAAEKKAHEEHPPTSLEPPPVADEPVDAPPADPAATPSDEPTATAAGAESTSATTR
jgi:Cytochrome c oxidase subunit IV